MGIENFIGNDIKEVKSFIFKILLVKIFFWVLINNLFLFY